MLALSNGSTSVCVKMGPLIKCISLGNVKLVLKGTIQLLNRLLVG